jgi:photosystem II stability/assembly factor-like uncharacterized protein
MTRLAFFVMILFAGLSTSNAQWEIEESHTTADLRGIHALGEGIAWASGSDGTVLRTNNDGKDWQRCATPPDAEHLDFRGIQAFDQNTAIVMSSGKGDLSRLYKTTDACKTWKLVFTNPDKEGFWDALQISWIKNALTDGRQLVRGSLIGDPVKGEIVTFGTYDGEHWSRCGKDQFYCPKARDDESLFAASNSSLFSNRGAEIFVTGGRSGSRTRVLSEYVKHDPRVSWKYVGGTIPLASGESAGAFSVALAPSEDQSANTLPNDKWTLLFAQRGIYVAVGGDYKKPDDARGTAAFSLDTGLHWTAAQTPPHGYRSSVAYDPTTKTWITVGPNGTDISRDDGRNWTALKPTAQDPPDADKNWNALSLPFVVGPKGRIGKLNAKTLAP